MGFHRLDLLPARDQAKGYELVARWETYKGAKLAEAIIDGIKDGAGKYFMDYIFEECEPGILRDACDMAGLSLSGLDLTFDDGCDTFKYIDFSYARWYGSKFRAASFFQCHVYFAKFYNINFQDCVICFTYFYGCEFERCTFLRCDFVDENGFTNCRFSDISSFDDCFFNKNKMIDCSLDSSCDIVADGSAAYLSLRHRPHRFKQYLDVKNISGIFQGFKEICANGSDYRRAREFSFLQSKAHTRFNSRFSIQNYFWEYLAGYGLKPSRVLVWYATLWALSLLWFTTKMKSSDAVIMSAGAVLTFGAKADLLDKLGPADTAVYLLSAFAGVSLLSLLVTVLVTKILAES